MAITEEVRIPIVGIDNVSGAFAKVALAGERMFKTFKAASSSLTELNQGMEILRKVTYGVGLAFRATAGQFADYETALVGVQKTTDISGQNLTAFGETVQAMSVDIPVAANELLKIAEIAGQLGVEGTDNLLLFTQTIAKIGVSTNLAAEEAATSFTRILNVTGQGIDQIDRFASVVVKLGNTFPATESEIAGMTNEVARAIAQFKVSAQEAAALGTALRSVGVRAELGGSTIGKAFRTIDVAIRTGGKEMEKIAAIAGMTRDEFKETFEKSSVKGFQVFIEGLGNVAKEGKSVTLALESIGLVGDEVNKVLPVLAARSDLVGKALAIANQEFKDNVALNEEASRAFSTLNSSFSKFYNSLIALGANIGAVVAPALKGLLDLATGTIETMRALVSNTDAFTASLKFLTAAAVTAFAVFKFGTILTALTQFMPVWLLFVKSLIPVGIAMGAIALKVSTLAISFGLLAATVELVARNLTNLDKVGAIVLGSVGTAINLARMQLLEFGKLIGIVLELAGAEETGASVLAKVEQEQLAIAENIQRSLDNIQDKSKDIDIGFSGEAVKTIFETLTKAKGEFDGVGKASEKASEAVGMATEAAAKDLEKLGKEFAKAINEAGNEVENILKSMSDRTRDIIKEVAMAGATPRGKIEIEAQTELMLIADFDKAKSEFDRLIAAQNAAGIQMTEAQKSQAKAFETSAKTVEDFAKAVESQKEQRLTDAGLGQDSPLAGGILEAGAAAAGGMASAVGSALSPVTAIMAAAQAVVGLLQQIIDFIPQFLDAVANLFSSLAELPLKISAAVLNLFKSVGKFISDFIPNLITMVGDLLESAVLNLADILPDAFASLGEKIPAFLTKLVERLPYIAEKFGESLVEMSGLMATRFAINFLKGIPAFVDAFIKAIPDIVEGFVTGLVEAFKVLANMISKALGFGNIFKIDVSQPIEELKKLGENIQRAAGNVFKVIDLEASARGLDVADRIRDAINSSLNRAKSIFQQLWDLLKKAWMWVWDNIIMPIWNLITKAFQWVWDNVILPIWNLVVKAFQWVWDNVIQPIWNMVVGAFQWVWDNVVQPIWNLITSVFQWVWDSIFQPINSMLVGTFNWIKTNIFDPINSMIVGTFDWIKKHIFEPINSMFVGTFGWIQGIFDGINSMFVGTFNWLKDTIFAPFIDAVGAIGNAGGGFLDSIGLAKGGIVPNEVRYLAAGGSVTEYQKHVLYAANGVMARGTDTVPAMLTPGEFIVNRDATRNNINVLKHINSTREPLEMNGSGGDTNFSIVINTKTDLSPDQIRREVIPTLEKELRKKSLAGKFVMADSGLRSRK